VGSGACPGRTPMGTAHELASCLLWGAPKILREEINHNERAPKAQLGQELRPSNRSYLNHATGDGTALLFTPAKGRSEGWREISSTSARHIGRAVAGRLASPIRELGWRERSCVGRTETNFIVKRICMSDTVLFLALGFTIGDSCSFLEITRELLGRSGDC
jgi:hypothetical protein